MNRRQQTIAAAAAVLLVSVPAALWAFGLLGKRTFEECVADEMRGRTKDQITIVQDACYKRHPAIPQLLKTNAFGSINCFGRTLKVSATFEIGPDVIRSDWGDWKITGRVPGVVFAELPGLVTIDFSEGTAITINFETGYAVMSGRGKVSGPSISPLECRWLKG